MQSSSNSTNQTNNCNITIAENILNNISKLVHTICFNVVEVENDAMQPENINIDTSLFFNSSPLTCKIKTPCINFEFEQEKNTNLQKPDNPFEILTTFPNLHSHFNIKHSCKNNPLNPTHTQSFPDSLHIPCCCKKHPPEKTSPCSVTIPEHLTCLLIQPKFLDTFEDE